MTVIVVAIVAVVAVIVVAAILNKRRSSRALKARFGSEYLRAMDEAGSQGKAEAALRSRQKRVSHFDIRPLTPSARDGFASNWLAIQSDFVEHPELALTKAESLLDEVMRARGYPVEDFEQRSADLSVDHPEVVQNYRAGRDIAARQSGGRVSTEELRQAMIHYRALFEELVGEVDDVARRRAS
jgi:type II secretory pathway pseudopilin PulG